MLIKGLHLTSFKGFSDFEVDFSPFTTLVGPNSGGKTSILRAVQLAFDFFALSFGGGGVRLRLLILNPSAGRATQARRSTV